MIQLVKSYPCLWKDKDRKYKNGAIRQRAWVEIGNALGRSHQVVYSKWRNLLNTYRRIRKDVSRNAVTGSGANDGCRQSWYAFDRMTFLNDTTTPRSSSSTANFAELPVPSTSTGQQCNESLQQCSVEASPEPSTSTMLRSRQPNRNQDNRSQQIADCLATINRLIETTASPQPPTRARSLAIFVEGQVAPFEKSDPEFCAKLISVVTNALHAEIDKYYKRDARTDGDHHYL
uniref:MADF domain-containing protein n=1 Tax=Anopheles culicifacies TaxID=139723 RepID=A0A182LYN6_9DIPT